MRSGTRGEDLQAVMHMLRTEYGLVIGSDDDDDDDDDGDDDGEDEGEEDEDDDSDSEEGEGAGGSDSSSSEDLEAFVEADGERHAHE